MSRALNYFEHFLSAVSGCVSFSAFASLVGVPVCIASSVVEIKIEMKDEVKWKRQWDERWNEKS